MLLALSFVLTEYTLIFYRRATRLFFFLSADDYHRHRDVLFFRDTAEKRAVNKSI